MSRPQTARVPILLYHGVTLAPAPEVASFSVAPHQFEQHLDLIEERGHQVLAVSDLVEMLVRNDPLPPRPVVLTFDDGFLDTLEVAVPALLARRFVATVYLTTGYLGRRGRPGPVRSPGQMLPWERVNDLEQAGLEVGAHSHSHVHLDIQRPLRMREEIRRSKELLTESLGHEVRSFAYPHGYASPSVRREVREAGFESACGVRNAISHPDDDRWFLARLTVRADTPMETITEWLRGEGAPLAAPGEALKTRAWREVRRVCQFALAPSGTRQLD